jgi:hypothetical protein
LTFPARASLLHALLVLAPPTTKERTVPITIVLTAVPAKFVRARPSGELTFITRPFGKKLGLSVLTVETTHHVTIAVGQFGAVIRSQYPNQSFTVVVRLRSGDNAPQGFNEALSSGALGQNTYTQVFEDCDVEACLASELDGAARAH